MLPLKRILCPIDFSVDSRAALKVAGELAHYFSAELTVLHAHVTPQPSVWPHEGLGIHPIETGLNNEKILALRESELAAEARAHLPENLKVNLVVKEGEPATVILDAAHDNHCDMIVIAPHGHNRIRKAIFGSTAEKVVRESPCPVVTLHAGQESLNQPKVSKEMETQT